MGWRHEGEVAGMGGNRCKLERDDQRLWLAIHSHAGVIGFAPKEPSSAMPAYHRFADLAATLKTQRYHTDRQADSSFFMGGGNSTRISISHAIHPWPDKHVPTHRAF